MIQLRQIQQFEQNSTRQLTDCQGKAMIGPLSNKNLYITSVRAAHSNVFALFLVVEPFELATRALLEVVKSEISLSEL